MTHYRVVVFSDNPFEVGNLLKPYNENDEAYYEFIPASSDVLERYRDEKMSDADFERYLTDCGYIASPEDGSVYGYMGNPNAKYDWYTRYPDLWEVRLKDGADENEDIYAYRKSQVDFTSSIYGTPFVPYAFVTPDGVWHAPGNVGWFGSSTETPEEWDAYKKEWDAYLASDTDPYVCIVDCHI